MAIFQLFLPAAGKLIEVFFSFPPEHFYNEVFDQNLQKFHQNSKNFYYIKFCDAFTKLESENFHNFINKKLVVSIFVTNRFCTY